MKNPLQSRRKAAQTVRALPASNPYGPGEPANGAAEESADELKSRIEAALQSRTNGDARRIRVEVAGDTVILTGKVRSWAVREAARAAAWAALGVGSVADRLIISY